MRKRQPRHRRRFEIEQRSDVRFEHPPHAHGVHRDARRALGPAGAFERSGGFGLSSLMVGTPKLWLTS